jgi:solute carrier family 25 citrate transporter 1
MLRQGANSAVRFSSYSTLKQLVQGNVHAGNQLPGWMTFGIGSMAGIITVCKSLSLPQQSPTEADVQTRPCLSSE